jgi:hypothetical protein
MYVVFNEVGRLIEHCWLFWELVDNIIFAKTILQLKVMFSIINDNWEVVENIIEKWGFSPSVGLYVCRF